MIKYRLTKKGKLVVVTLCTFIMLCVFIGATYEGNNTNKYYDYSKPDENNQEAQLSELEPPYSDAAKEENWKELKASVYFEPNLTSFNDKYGADLDSFIAAVQKHDNTKVQIEGNCATLFPNNPKQKDINYNLSLLRAQSVANYFESKGVSIERLIIKGNGSDKPIKDNSSPEGRKLNRRVDVFFVE